MQDWPADSIDLVVTSPPYWGLRDYGEETVRVWGGNPECEHKWGINQPPIHKGQVTQTKYGDRPSSSEGGVAPTGNYCSECGAWRGSLGLEPHPQLFIDHLVEICREIRRVMKPSGTFWLNLGDTYWSKPWRKKNVHHGIKSPNMGFPTSCVHKDYGPEPWMQPKQKLMIPSRVAITLQHDGWILRSDIIWHKPNHMPSSVKDRLTCAYEHIFLFAKARRYYFDLDAIRKPHTSDGEYRNKLRAGKEKYTGKGAWSIHEFGSTSVFNMGSTIHPKGKNPGDLWRIPTTPFPGAHFATFPPKLIAPIVKAGCPRWICSRCGKPRTRIIETDNPSKYLADDGIRGWSNIAGQKTSNPQSVKSLHRNISPNGKTKGVYYSGKTVGWSDCGCEADWVGGVVLDPFAGSGTALRVARRLGRRFIGIEIKPEYAEMARQRVRGKYKPVPEGVIQLDQLMEDEE